MPVALRPTTALEPVLWPTGEEVAVRRPNLYAAALYDREVQAVLSEPEKLRNGLVSFVAMVCPGKTPDQIREECDDEFLWLVAHYSRERLAEAQAVLEAFLGKSPAGTAPASAPPTPTGTSVAESPEPAGAPCGS